VLRRYSWEKKETWAILKRFELMKEEKMTVWSNVHAWEHERFQIRKKQGANLISENTHSKL